MKIVRKLLNGLAIAFAVYFAIAFTLIYTDRAPPPAPGGGLDFAEAVQDAGVAAPAPQTYLARDGSRLPLRVYEGPGEGAPLVILLHGSGWFGQQFEALAPRLADIADVLVPDLRGHGRKPDRRGDVDYIGQLEDDIADLIAARARPGQKVVLAGHSSGGGLVVRFAGGANGAMIDGAVLLAPFLKYNAPTTRASSGGWARPMTRRIIGLSMLNAANIRTFNHLPVIRFNFPPAVLTGPLGANATLAYSYRLNVSYAPRSDYLADVAALPPFLLIAGREDEAFVASAYEPLMSAVNSRGEYLLVDGVGHLGIVDAPETEAAIKGFLRRFAAGS